MTGKQSSEQAKAASAGGKLSAREWALLVPNIAKLLGRLARDRRVPIGTKLLVVGAGLYLACPVDLIPDWIPGLGYLDDVLLVALLVHRLVRTVPAQVLREHWHGAIPLPELARRLSLRGKREKGRDD